MGGLRNCNEQMRMHFTHISKRCDVVRCIWPLSRSVYNILAVRVNNTVAVEWRACKLVQVQVSVAVE